MPQLKAATDGDKATAVAGPVERQLTEATPAGDVHRPSPLSLPVTSNRSPRSTDGAAVRAGGRPKVSWWQVLRVVLVLGWLAWAGLAWWAAPRESSAEQARADLAAGRLTYYEWGDGWRNDGGLISPYPLELGSRPPQDRCSCGTPPTAGGAAPPWTCPPSSTRRGWGPRADALDKELQAYEARRPTQPPIDSVRTALFVAGCVLFLWALVSAANPVTGTRWFWFWLVTLHAGRPGPALVAGPGTTVVARAPDGRSA